MAAPAGVGGRWYLTFDCATKSFAFALVFIDFESPHDYEATCLGLGATPTAGEAGAGEAGAGEAISRLRGKFRLAVAEAADLVPGVSDKDLGTVARIRALLPFLEARVAPAVGAHCPPGTRPDVVVEYQMGPNAPARAVANALVARYAGDHDVFLVGPARKNRVALPGRPDLSHSAFAERFMTTYGANKAHTRALYFEGLAPLFGHAPPPGVPRAFRKDAADAIVQALAFHIYADRAAAANMF